VLDDIEAHCPLYALPGDVARAGLSPQKAYTQLIRNLVQGVRGRGRWRSWTCCKRRAPLCHDNW
jgi:hypothetical protein